MNVMSSPALDEYGMLVARAVPTTPPAIESQGIERLLKWREHYVQLGSGPGSDIRAKRQYYADEAFAKENPPMTMAEFERVNVINGSGRPSTVSKYEADIRDNYAVGGPLGTGSERELAEVRESVNAYRSCMSRCPPARLAAYGTALPPPMP